MKSENSMLRNQVAFMEKLLLQRGSCGLGGVDGNQENGQLQRTGKTSAPFAKNLGVLALVCTVMISTYLPDSTSNTPSSPIQQRILAEIGSGFHLYKFQGPSSYLLSVFRAAVFGLFLFYTFITVLSAFKRLTKPSTEDILEELLHKKNT